MKLKPCPFCGNEKPYKFMSIDGEDFVRCGGQDCPIVLLEITPEEWNTRAPENKEDVALAYERKEMVKYLIEAVNQLPEREAKIIRLRFGVDGEKPHKIREIAEIEGVSNERISQIIERAFYRIRYPGKNKELREYRP